LQWKAGKALKIVDGWYNQLIHRGCFTGRLKKTLIITFKNGIKKDCQKLAVSFMCLKYSLE